MVLDYAKLAAWGTKIGIVVAIAAALFVGGCVQGKRSCESAYTKAMEKSLAATKVEAKANAEYAEKVGEKTAQVDSEADRILGELYAEIERLGNRTGCDVPSSELERLWRLYETYAGEGR